MTCYNSLFFIPDVVEHAKKARVFFIDYGNEELVSISSFLKISQDLLSFPPQATLCSIYGVRSFSLPALNQHFMFYPLNSWENVCVCG